MNAGCRTAIKAWQPSQFLTTAVSCEHKTPHLFFLQQCFCVLRQSNMQRAVGKMKVSTSCVGVDVPISNPAAGFTFYVYREKKMLKRRPFMYVKIAFGWWLHKLSTRFQRNFEKCECATYRSSLKYSWKSKSKFGASYSCTTERENN